MFDAKAVTHLRVDTVPAVVLGDRNVGRNVHELILLNPLINHKLIAFKPTLLTVRILTENWEYLQELMRDKVVGMRTGVLPEDQPRLTLLPKTQGDHFSRKLVIEDKF